MPTEFDVAARGFTVRKARAADAAACRMMLPEAPAGAERWIAVERDRGLAIGAAALNPALRTAPLLGPGVMIHVIPPCRGVGVGSALRAQLETHARRNDWQALYATQRVESDSEEMHRWQRLGFDVCETVEEHELPLDQFEPRLAPVVERFRRRGAIPADAQIVPLYAVDPLAVLQLHLHHLGGDRESLLRKLHGQGDGAFHPRYSRVLTLKGRTVGCILAHRKSASVAAVDATILAAEVRGGWANAWLKLEATRGAASLGITHFHFSTFDQYADTRRFTAKLGGTTARTWALMMRPLPR